MQTVQTKQVVQLLCLLFLNCDLHLIKVCTPFSYSFGNILTPHSKILRGSFEVMLFSGFRNLDYFTWGDIWIFSFELIESQSRNFISNLER